jgi:hypothetical protein
MSVLATNKREAAKAQQIRAQAARLRTELAEVDLDSAMTFVRLAYADLHSGDAAHADRLLARAEDAAAAIAKLLRGVPQKTAKTLQPRLDELVSAIGDAKNGR